LDLGKGRRFTQAAVPMLYTNPPNEQQEGEYVLENYRPMFDFEQSEVMIENKQKMTVLLHNDPYIL
jgi:hypothetical protein